jgi:hypothetical protein
MFKGIDASVTARDVSRRINRGTRCYVFPSSKEPGVIHSMESYQEFKRALLLDVDPRVKKFRDQPWTIDLDTAEIMRSKAHFSKLKGHKRRLYTPDSECHMIDGRIRIVEVKRETSEDDKYILAEKMLNQHGYDFLMLAGEDISGVLVRNACCLQRTRAEHFKKDLPALLDQLNALASMHQDWAFEELAARNSFGIFGVYAGLANGIFAADMNLDLVGTNAKISSAFGDMEHLFLGFL